MEEPRRIGTVGRWVSHWSFWPTYALGVIALLASARPWSTERPTDAFKGPTGITVYDAANLQGRADSPVGTVLITTTDAQPDAHWLPCDGRHVARADYQELSTLAGDRFGSDADELVLPSMPTLSCALLIVGLAEHLELEEADAAEALSPSPNHVRFWIKAR